MSQSCTLSNRLQPPLASHWPGRDSSRPGENPRSRPLCRSYSMSHVVLSLRHESVCEKRRSGPCHVSSPQREDFGRSRSRETSFRRATARSAQTVAWASPLYSSQPTRPAGRRPNASPPQTKKGYALIESDISGQLVNPELAAAIIRANDGASDGGDEPDVVAIDPYLVYGDWLQARGDPRGELVAVQVQRLRQPDKALQALENRLFKQHSFLPDRLRHMIELGRRRRRRASGSEAQRVPCDVEWRFGFVHRARIGRDSKKTALYGARVVRRAVRPPLGASPPRAHDRPAGPVGRVRLRADRGRDRPPWANLAARPVHRRFRPRKTGSWRPASWATSAACTADCPISAACIFAPARCSSATSRGRRCASSASRPLPSRRRRFAPWPRPTCRALRRLSIAVSGSLPPTGLATFLASSRLPALRHLRIAGTAATHELWRALAASPLAGHLETLDLSSGTLADRDVDDLIAARLAFGQVVRVDLSGNTLSNYAASSLRDAWDEIGVELIAEEQRAIPPPCRQPSASKRSTSSPPTSTPSFEPGESPGRETGPKSAASERSCGAAARARISTTYQSTPAPWKDSAAAPA